MRPSVAGHRFANFLLVAVVCGGCVALPVGTVDVAPSRGISFDPLLYPHPEEITAGELDVRIDEREIVDAPGGRTLLRVRFSFASYHGFVGEDDAHRSSGALWVPTDGEGNARPDRIGYALITEHPPGSSLSAFPFWREYGERPAAELGVVAAVVDVRGPVASSLREYVNPADPDGSPFASEPQLAYAMLREYQRTGDMTVLYEYHVAWAWLRALRAVDAIVAEETGVSRNAFLVVAQDYGALGAAQAAVLDDGVRGLVLTGWPLDFADFHYTRWRRWELAAGYAPLHAIQPIPFADSHEVFTFLASTPYEPDPGCPACPAGGDGWLAQFDLLRLWRAGDLRTPLFLLAGDSDPSSPIDLELRTATSAESAPPEFVLAPDGGPLRADARRFPWVDLHYLRDSASTLAHADASDCVRAWMQHVIGSRELPRIDVVERRENGDIVIEIVTAPGATSISDVEVSFTEIDARRDSDFLWRTHQPEPERVDWRRPATIYGGPRGFADGWSATLPPNPGVDRAYYVSVLDRAGDREAWHSLPVRTFWNLGDPARRRVRF